MTPFAQLTTKQGRTACRRPLPERGWIEPRRDLLTKGHYAN